MIDRSRLSVNETEVKGPTMTREQAMRPTPGADLLKPKRQTPHNHHSLGNCEEEESGKGRRKRLLPPLVHVSEEPPPPDLAMIVEGLIPAEYPGLIYGDGGTTKTLLAIAMGMHVADPSRADFCALPIGVHGPVLYIDGEMDKHTFTRRSNRLAAGMGFHDVPEGLKYQNLAGRTLSDPEVVKELGERIAEVAPVFIVIDSWQFSTGANPLDPDEILGILRSLKQWGGQAILIIDHERASQPGEGARDMKNPYGSRYKFNAARSSIRVVNAARERVFDEEGTKIVTLGLVLTQYKNSEDDLHEKIYLRVIFHGKNATEYQRSNADDPLFTEPEPAPKESADDKALAALAKHPAGITAADLATEMGHKQPAMQNRLSILRASGKAASIGGLWRIRDSSSS